MLLLVATNVTETSYNNQVWTQKKHCGEPDSTQKELRQHRVVQPRSGITSDVRGLKVLVSPVPEPWLLSSDFFDS